MKLDFKIDKRVIYLGVFAGLLLMIMSSIYTYTLFESMAHGQILGIALGISGVCIDIGKVVAASTMIYFLYRKNYTLAIASMIFYLLAFYVSIVASQSLDLNKSNEIINEVVIESDEYKTNKTLFDDSTLELGRLRQEIEDINNNRKNTINNAIAHLEAERIVAKKNNWLTTPQGSPRRGVDVIDKDIATTKAAQNKLIDDKIKTIKDEIKAEKSAQSNTKSILDDLRQNSGVKYTKGLIAYSKSKNPDDPNRFMMKFYVFKNILTELLGSFLILLASVNFGENSAQSRVTGVRQGEQNQAKAKANESKNDESGKDNIINLNKKKNITNEIVSEKDIELYTNKMYELSKNILPEVIGCINISKSLGFSKGKGEKIKKILTKRKLIETKGTRTYLSNTNLKRINL